MFHLTRLRSEHARLHEEITRELRRPAPDFTRLRELKQKKLAVKDRLTRLDATVAVGAH
jgi:hypothetical protein